MSWFTEKLYADWRTSYRIRKELLRKRTRFQRMRILETDRCGRMLVLDDIAQTCEFDEFIYHEMLTHVPLVAHGKCKKVLILGGGDGGCLREVLRHPVERAVMVEIDRDVVAASAKHLPSLNDGAFTDPRLELVFEDGAEYVQTTGERFDAVIVDSTDPIGPGAALFTTGFCRDLLRVLKPGGVTARQAGAAMLQSDELADAWRKMNRVFPHVAVYLAPVPTYIGGFFSFVLGSKSAATLRVSNNRLRQRLQKLHLNRRYYNAQIHRACFALPNCIREHVK